ncbi:MAG: pyridoxamine 5'-phosphate oxidase family protein [Chloroflexota bacterium]
MTTFEKTALNRVKRIPDRGKYDKETVYSIVDAALICHVGFVVDERPFVIPTIHARDGDTLLLHGASTSRMLKTVQQGGNICVTITLLDGLVMARSVFHHSMNYRSAVIFGRGSLVEGAERKNEVLEIFTEKLIPGRWADARGPYPKETKATAVIEIPIDSASAKVRVGPPGDDDEDYALPVWAGVLPITRQFGAPIDDPLLTKGIEVPNYISEYVAGGLS